MIEEDIDDLERKIKILNKIVGKLLVGRRVDVKERWMYRQPSIPGGCGTVIGYDPQMELYEVLFGDGRTGKFEFENIRDIDVR